MNDLQLLTKQLEMLEHAFGTLDRELKRTRRKPYRMYFASACKTFKQLLDIEDQLRARQHMATLSDEQVKILLQKLSEPESAKTE